MNSAESLVARVWNDDKENERAHLLHADAGIDAVRNRQAPDNGLAREIR